MKCRLLYINANTKTVGLSLQENVVLNKATSFGNWSIGDIIEDAVVMRVDQGMGLLMRLSDNSLGFAHVSTSTNGHFLWRTVHTLTLVWTSLQRTLSFLHKGGRCGEVQLYSELSWVEAREQVLLCCPSLWFSSFSFFSFFLINKKKVCVYYVKLLPRVHALTQHLAVWEWSFARFYPRTSLLYSFYGAYSRHKTAHNLDCMF